MKLGYDSTKQGKRNNLILCKCLPVEWKYLSGVIRKCLGHKTVNIDQLNLFEICIQYTMVKNKHLDFAKLIFDQLVVSILGKKRSSFVLYLDSRL